MIACCEHGSQASASCLSFRRVKVAFTLCSAGEMEVVLLALSSLLLLSSHMPCQMAAEVWNWIPKIPPVLTGALAVLLGTVVLQPHCSLLCWLWLALAGFGFGFGSAVLHHPHGHSHTHSLGTPTPHGLPRHLSRGGVRVYLEPGCPSVVSISSQAVRPWFDVSNLCPQSHCLYFPRCSPPFVLRYALCRRQLVATLQLDLSPSSSLPYPIHTPAP